MNSDRIATEGELRDGGEGIMSGEFLSGREELGERKSERKRVWDGKGPSGGRGGSCTLNSGFFGTVMRSLVEFEERRYLVDVGFGANGPTAPLQLKDGK